MKVTRPDGIAYGPLSNEQPHIVLMEYPDGKRVAFTGNVDEENTWRYLSLEHLYKVSDFLNGHILVTVPTDDYDGDEDI